MGFYSELQMEMDDFEVRHVRKADLRAAEICTKKVHAERRMRELTWEIQQLEPGNIWTRGQLLKHCIDIKTIFSSAEMIAQSV